jgi:hypothetical protein
MAGQALSPVKKATINNALGFMTVFAWRTPRGSCHNSRERFLAIECQTSRRVCRHHPEGSFWQCAKQSLDRQKPAFSPRRTPVTKIGFLLLLLLIVRSFLRKPLSQNSGAGEGNRTVSGLGSAPSCRRTNLYFFLGRQGLFRAGGGVSFELYYSCTGLLLIDYQRLKLVFGFRCYLASTPAALTNYICYLQTILSAYRLYFLTAVFPAFRPCVPSFSGTFPSSSSSAASG